MAKVQKQNEVIIKESDYNALANKVEGTVYKIVDDNDITRIIKTITYASSREFVSENDKYYVVELDATYSWQIQEDGTWISVVVHNLNKNPSVSVMDETGQEIQTIVYHIDKNSLKLKINQGTFNGFVYLN